MISIKSDGLYTISKDGQEIKISGPIEVKAIVSSSDKRDDFGLLIEWKNYFGISMREVLSMGEIDDYSARKFKKKLLSSGFQLSTRRNTWDLLLSYLIESPRAEHAYSARQSGWVGRQFVTPDWSIGKAQTPAVYIGDSAAANLIQSGTLSDWQQHVGRYCRGNPMMILAVCCALAAPLIEWTGIESFGIQIVGDSKSGKSTAMKVAASMYSDQSYWETWSSTSNGIESIARARNNMLLCLDEFKQCPAQEMDRLIYHLCNGVSKLRSERDGSLGKRHRWRTIFLSTGELTLEELFLTINQKVSAGQAVRFIEIPTFGAFDVFDDTHEFSSAKEFAEHLGAGTIKYYGTLAKAWVETLARLDSPEDEVIKEYRSIRQEWPWSNDIGSQANNVLDKLALLAAAGEIAANNGLLPWHLGDAKDALRRVATIWLDDRNSNENVESKRIANKLLKLINKWRHSIVPKAQNVGGAIGTFEIDQKLIWCIPQKIFRSAVIESSSREFRQTINYMWKKGWLITNEGDRRTFKIGNERFVKFFPAQICQDCGDSVDLSHFSNQPNHLINNKYPTIPTSQSENQEC